MTTSYMVNLILALFQIVLIINTFRYFYGLNAIIDATATSPVPVTKSKHIVNNIMAEA